MFELGPLEPPGIDSQQGTFSTMSYLPRPASANPMRNRLSSGGASHNTHDHPDVIFEDDKEGQDEDSFAIQEDSGSSLGFTSSRTGSPSRDCSPVPCSPSALLSQRSPELLQTSNSLDAPRQQQPVLNQPQPLQQLQSAGVMLYSADPVKQQQQQHRGPSSSINSSTESSQAAPSAGEQGDVMATLYATYTATYGAGDSRRSSISSTSSISSSNNRNHRTSCSIAT